MKPPNPIRVRFNYRVVVGPWGGANSFLRALLAVLKDTSDIRVVGDAGEDYDILFLNQLANGPGRNWWTPRLMKASDVDRIKQFGSRSRLKAAARRLTRRETSGHRAVVCRLVNLTGRTHGRTSQRDVELLAALERTDFDIFQSRFSYEVFQQAGYHKEHFAIISNGVDQKVFNLHDKVWWDGQSALRAYSCTFGTRRSKRFDLIARFSELPDVECLHIGAWPKDIDPKNVRLLGLRSQQEAADLYRRDGHIFIFPAERDTCPNAVIEALSSGLPVLFRQPGGTQELVEACGLELADDQGAALQQVRDGYSSFVSAIRERWPRYSVEYAANQYLRIFRQVANQMQIQGSGL